MTRKQYFLSGLKDGMPICFGYFAVSFAFGIQAAGIGLSVFEASVLSALNVTSAGQFAALAIIASGASLIELAFTQLIINLRYFLMSCALSQKLSPSLPLGHRLGIAYGMTDEIFAVSVSQREPLSPFYSYGLIAVAIPGWVLGTALGAGGGQHSAGRFDERARHRDLRYVHCHHPAACKRESRRRRCGRPFHGAFRTVHVSAGAVQHFFGLPHHCHHAYHRRRCSAAVPHPG